MHVPATFANMPWPKTVPEDLRRKLEAVLGYRNRPMPQDLWGAVLEWLEAEGVTVPSDIDRNGRVYAPPRCHHLSLSDRSSESPKTPVSACSLRQSGAEQPPVTKE